MPRIEVVPRFTKAYRRLDAPLRDAVDKALRNLVERPELKGLNLEPVQGRAGFFTIRATRNFRILLRRKQDEQGSYFSVEDVDKHDIYKGRP